MRLLFIIWALFAGLANSVVAQDLTVSTVTRAPFSMVVDGKHSGFSIDLWDALSKELDMSYHIVRSGTFTEMLTNVQQGTADLAIANISITAGREAVLDFSQPIFQSGLQMMTSKEAASDLSAIRVVLSRDFLGAAALALLLLIVAGMIMWGLERKAQPYFDMPAKKAVFPAFWWALNLVVNGGFEERVPRTPVGRLFAVFLVISSLFLVSVFVAQITAVLTVGAIESNIKSISDLYGKRVGTISSSTAASFLATRDIEHSEYVGLESLLLAFEEDQIDAVVFDSPILRYYASKVNPDAQLVGNVFRPENYGIALPSGSTLAEPINQGLLRLRENGTYDDIRRKWFGAEPY